MAGHDPVSPGNAVTTQASPTCPSTGETRQRHGRHRRKRGQTRASVVFGAHLASAVSLFFLLFEGRPRAESTSAFGLHLKRRRSKPFAEDRRAPPWLGSRCSTILSAFDATTSTRARPDIFAVVGVEAVISHSHEEKESIWRVNYPEQFSLTWCPAVYHPPGVCFRRGGNR